MKKSRKKSRGPAPSGKGATSNRSGSDEPVKASIIPRPAAVAADPDVYLLPLPRVPVPVLVVAAGLTAVLLVSMLLTFGFQITEMNERSALRRCWVNQKNLAEAIEELREETGVTTAPLKFNADLHSFLVRHEYLREPLRDTELDRRGADGSWKYYQILSDDTVSCAYHGPVPKKNIWQFDLHLPRKKRESIPPPPREPLPAAFLAKTEFDEKDEHFAGELQDVADY